MHEPISPFIGDPVVDIRIRFMSTTFGSVVPIKNKCFFQPLVWAPAALIIWEFKPIFDERNPGMSKRELGRMPSLRGSSGSQSNRCHYRLRFTVARGSGKEKRKSTKTPAQKRPENTRSGSQNINTPMGRVFLGKRKG